MINIIKSIRYKCQTEYGHARTDFGREMIFLEWKSLGSFDAVTAARLPGATPDQLTREGFVVGAPASLSCGSVESDDAVSCTGARCVRAAGSTTGAGGR